MKSDALIEIDHVSFGYDERRSILNDVSLRFMRGKVTAILGGSGCGKTTLMRLIGGVHAATKGRVVFDGEVLNIRNKAQMYGLRRRLGMLFQFCALFTDLSVFENVAFPLRENTDLPEAMIRDIVLMKLNAVGLRGAAAAGCRGLGGGGRGGVRARPGGREAQTTAERIGADGLQGGDEGGGAFIGFLRRGQQGLGSGEKTDESEEERSKARFHG